MPASEPRFLASSTGAGTFTCLGRPQSSDHSFWEAGSGRSGVEGLWLISLILCFVFRADSGKAFQEEEHVPCMSVAFLGAPVPTQKGL